MPHALVRWLVRLVAVLGCALPLCAQDYVRSWGDNVIDTRVHEVEARQIAVSGYNTSVLTRDGRIFVLGQNPYSCAEVPLPPPGRRYSGVGGGHYATLGLLDDGSVAAWGFSSAIFPVVPPLPPGLIYTWVSPHGTVLRRSDGAYLCTKASMSMPTLPPGTTPVRVATGFAGIGVVASDGSLVMTGNNGYGQMDPPPLPPGVRYTDVAIGYYHSAALRSDGEIVDFGEPTWLGVPPLPAGTRYLLLTAGQSHTVAYRSDNVLVAWGNNWWGQLEVPVLPAGIQCVQLGAGQLHTAALLSDGRVVTWGEEAFFGCGLPALPGTAFPGPWGQPTTRHAHVTIGIANGIFVYADGTVAAFGDSNQVAVPPLPPGVHYLRADAGYNHSVLLRSDGELVLLGDGSAGQGAFPALPVGMSWVDFASAPGHTAMLRSDGQAFGCGSNASGQLNIPALPPGLEYVDVDADVGKTMLVRSDGQILFAGDAYHGAVAPPPLPAHLQYVSVAAGEGNNLAIRSDGQAVQWANGPLSSYAPVPALPFGVSYVEVAAGDGTGVLRRSDGEVVVCGVSGLTGYGYLAHVPPLERGESYLQLSAAYGNMVARVGPTCIYRSFASGCAGSLPAVRLVPRDTPRIGRNHQVRLFDLPLDVALLTMGFHRQPDVDLGALGMPGCTWFVASDATAALGGQDGQAVWELPIPDVASLVGIEFFHQALLLDSGAGNPLGLVVSDAAIGVVGYP